MSFPNQNPVKIFGGLGATIFIVAIVGIIYGNVPLSNQEQQNTRQGVQNDQSSLSNTTNETGLFSVVKVVDGDTVDLNINGKIERVRLIGMNTPETVDPRKPVECFGKEASNRAKELLTGNTVKIEADSVGDTRDKYGRLLLYIFLDDGSNFSKKMIMEGYAYEHTYGVKYKYQVEFKEAQKYAEDNKLGLWAPGVCSARTFNPEQTPGLAPLTQPTSCNIKGNISSGGKIYHLSGCGSYDKTVIDESAGERWFCSEQEALNAGWRKALNCL